MRTDVLRRVVEEVLCCPRCRGKLALEANGRTMPCQGCAAAYPIHEGIPVLLPDGPVVQERERRFRDALAAEQAAQDGQAVLEVVGRHHCVPVMRRHAARFRARFTPDTWVLDVGIGYGWHWTRPGEGARILGIDFSLGNLTLARRLLGEDREDVVLVCADAEALPLRDHTMTGLWSVQAFQHFPQEVLRAVLHELERVLKAACVIEVYNLHPAALHRTLSRLLGKRLHGRGPLGEMELNRLAVREWVEVWRTFRGGRSQIHAGYSELFFHPDLRLRPRRYPTRLEAALAGYAPALASLIARQAQLRIEARP